MYVVESSPITSVSPFGIKPFELSTLEPFTIMLRTSFLSTSIVLFEADPKNTHNAITKFQPPSYRPKVFGPSGVSMRVAKIIDSCLSHQN